MAEVALIVGAGPRVGAATARLAAAQGMRVAAATRGAPKWDVGAIGGRAYSCDATKREDIERLFAAVAKDLGPPDLVLFNPAARVAGPIADIDPKDAARPMAILTGAFLVAQQAAKAMVARGSGTILFTGSSASVQGPVQQGPVAMYKFGIRGLAQALARELHPQNVHIGHVYVNNAIAALGATDDTDHARAEDIAATFLALHRQHRSTWAWEVGLSPASAGIVA